MDDHTNRLFQDRSTLSKALEDDLAKLAESRLDRQAGAGQVEKLAEAAISSSALEADLNTIRAPLPTSRRG